jgi:hypothetical protein
VTLQQIISDLERLDGDLTICAAKTPVWTESSAAVLCRPDVGAAEFPLPYFLEIAVAKDVLRAWSHLRGGRIPTITERCEAIIYYAENDAYLLPNDAATTS